MMAKMHYRMHLRFQKPIDLEEAIHYFHDVTSIFPKSSLADDALFLTGEIFLLQKNDPQQAADFYRKISTQFPEGDKLVQANSRLQELFEKHNISLPEDVNSSGFSKSLVNVLPVKYWSSDEYTRIVIRASQPVRYTANLLEQNGDQPRRLYVDFAQSYTPPQFRAPVPIQDGLLKQIRTGQFDPTTVRVVLDIQSISNYKIFSLNDPFRVIIDVHGVEKKATAQTDSAPKITPVAPPITLKIEETKQKEAQIKRQTSTSDESQKSAHIPTELDNSLVISLKDDKKRKPFAPSKNKKLPASDMKISLAQQLGLGVKRIVIDPGHGGKDPGAMAFGMKEKDIVLSIAKNVAGRLKDEYGYEVLLTRNSDTFLPLEERTAIANTQKADLFVSIHVNAHPDKSIGGVETFYLNLATNTEAMRVAARENATSTHNISDLQNILSDLMQNSKIQESSRLAEYVNSSMVEELAKKFSVKNLGVKQAPFYVLIGAEMPAVLAEVSFITNPKESKLLQQKAYLQIIGQQIADGVAGYVDHHITAALQL
jgi:N-acetylmuramoyl-L-alanine amidase